MSWFRRPKLPVVAAPQTQIQVTAAHDQTFSHHYTLHYPEHYPRKDDPNYVDFNAYHRKHRKTARCFVGQRIGFDECADAKGNPTPPPADGSEQAGLELHHSHIEFSLQNGIDIKALEVDFPGISDPKKVGSWVESDINFMWLCAKHHRANGAGVHSLAYADWEASKYVKGLTQ
jgi:hypothetical protein